MNAESDSRVRRAWVVTLTVPSPVNPGPRVIGAATDQVVPLRYMPVVATFRGFRVVCESRRLPFRTASVASLRCCSALEVIIDDQAFMNGIARVVAPGGEIDVIVPNARGLGAIDPINARRYIQDVTRRGRQLPQLAEVGWRRHYQPRELRQLLVRAGFHSVDIVSHGAGLRSCAELVTGIVRELAGFQADLASSSLSAPDEQCGLVVPWKLGIWLQASARRNPAGW